MLKIRLCQWRFVERQSMLTCPAAAEQNDGDKRRKNGPGKVTTVSVGQGEPPTNLLTVIHKARKSHFSCFLLRGHDCASRIATHNGDKSKLHFLVVRPSSAGCPGHRRRVMTREFPFARPPGCPSMSLASQPRHSAATIAKTASVLFSWSAKSV
jgi:hypothetical protein